MAIDPKTGLNKAKDRRGTTPPSLAAARANAKRAGAKKGETRALRHGAFASDATLEKLSIAGRTFEETAKLLAASLEDAGTHSAAHTFAVEQYLRDFHRYTHLSEQGDSLTVAATAERLELSRSLTKQASSLLLTPESQHRAGVPERKAAAERVANTVQPHQSQEARVALIRTLVSRGVVPGCTVVPLAGESLDPKFEALVRRLIIEGRIAGAFLAAVPDTFVVNP